MSLVEFMAPEVLEWKPKLAEVTKDDRNLLPSWLFTGLDFQEEIYYSQNGIGNIPFEPNDAKMSQGFGTGYKATRRALVLDAPFSDSDFTKPFTLISKTRD